MGLNQVSNYGASPLHCASFRADAPMVAFLLQTGANTGSRTQDGGTALHCALGHFPNTARHGTLHYFTSIARNQLRGDRTKSGVCETLRLLLKRGSDPNARRLDGTTPLMLVADSPRSISNRLCRMLLQAGAVPDVQITEGITALHLAGSAGNCAVVKMLLAAGTDPNARDKRGMTPLLFALQDPREDMEPPEILPRKPNLRIVDILHKFGADVNAANMKGTRPIHVALYKSPALAQQLLTMGADPTVTDNEGFTTLMSAAGARNLRLIRYLLDVGININAETDSGYTALKAAIAVPWPGKFDHENVSIVRFLLKCGASVHVPANGEQPLHRAVHCRFCKITQLMLAAGADIEAVNDRGLTAIEVLLSHRDSGVGQQILEILLSCKPDLNHRFDPGPGHRGTSPLQDRCDWAPATTRRLLGPGISALELAVVTGWGRDTIQKLLEHDASLEGVAGRRALFAAASFNKDPHVVEFLIERNVDVCACNEDGKTALHYAADNCAHEGIFTALIKAGAKVDARDKLGKTPLHYAAATYCPGSVRVLLESGADPSAKAADGRTPKELARRDTRMLFE